MSIDNAFILAAGFGKRLRPHTENKPKPLVEVGSKSLLEHTLDKLEAAGVKNVMINTHYLGEQIEESVKSRATPNIHLSREAEILDTGGGIYNTIDFFGDDPFFVVSGDGLWDDGPGKASLELMKEAWDEDKMDILLLLQPVETMSTTQGVGDYTLDQDGRCIRSLDQSGTHMWTSIRINHPRIFDDAPEEPFSYLELLDRAQAQGRLYGVINDGLWHHISTPEDLESVREYYDERNKA